MLPRELTTFHTAPQKNASGAFLPAVGGHKQLVGQKPAARKVDWIGRLVGRQCHDFLHVIADRGADTFSALRYWSLCTLSGCIQRR